MVMTIIWFGILFVGVNAILAIVGTYYSVLRKHYIEKASLKTESVKN
jgi:hypothetical protein